MKRWTATIATVCWSVLLACTNPCCGQESSTLSSPAVSPAAAEIRYKLPGPGRVSLAIYDKDGIQIRTLRNAQPQAAGEHTIVWDGLDQEGQPALPGTYTWKLLQGQGLKAEYWFSFGVSTGLLPWPGNHSGPVSLSVEGDRVLVAAAASEGCAQLIGMNRAGEIGMASAPGSSVEDMSHAGNLIYLASTELGRLNIINAETGERVWWFHTNGPPTLGIVKDVTKPVPTLTKGKQQIYRYDVPNNGGWNWYTGRATLSNSLDQPLTVKLSTSIAQGQPIPFRDVKLEPKETVTIDLARVVVHWSSEEQFVLGVEGEPGWELQRLEILTSADRVAAKRREQVPAGQTLAAVDADQYKSPEWVVSDNEVWVGYTRAGLIQQIQPKRDGKVLREVRVPEFQDMAFTRDGQLLLISGRSVCRLDGDTLVPLISGLEAPRRIAVDATTGDLFLVEGGPHQQVRRYDAAYKLQQVYGRDGGRQYGLYKPENFYNVEDVAGDGLGGFYIVENCGARRTAHFDPQGRVLREWYGGEGFQQYVTQDPQHPNRFWLGGYFNPDVMECEVDWEKRDWRVRAVYDVHDELAKTLGGLVEAPVGFVSGRMYVKDRDLDGDGTPERLLWVENMGYLMRIDEAAGRVVPLAGTGLIQDDVVRILQSNQPTEVERRKYGPLLATFETRPKTRVTPRYWSWADADGDGRMQPEEIELFAGDWNNGTYVGGYFCAIQMEDDLSVWQRSGWGMPPGGPSWYLMRPTGYTRVGAPIWKLDQRTRSIADGGMMHTRFNADGSTYEVRIVRGEGYTSNGVSSTGGHGFSWPANLDDSTQFVRRNADGRVMWKVGRHAPVEKNDPGQLHAPLRVAGVVRDCVGVADHIGNPLAVWTTDGLFVGDLFDRRADDGLPGMAYCWFEYRGAIPREKQRGEFFDKWAVNQYDMVSNGLLSRAGNGDVFYMSTGLNSAPLYRITGWDELQRQQGELVLRNTVAKPVEAGSGLSATYFPAPDFKGEPERRVDGPLWFGVKTSRAKKPWPLPAIAAGACSVVWEGSIQPKFTEPGRLLVYTDLSVQDPKAPPPQRVRLWVNGKLELDYWDHRDFREIHLRTRQFDWKAGERVPVRVEYSCDKPSDELSLCWESPSVEVQHIPANCLYPK